MLSGEFPSDLLPRDFVADYSRVVRRVFKALANVEGEASGAEVEEIAWRAATALERGLPTADGAAEFERRCQEESHRIVTARGLDESAVREIRKASGVWALHYQRFVLPENA